MRNFSYQNPTKLIFGKNTIGELANEIPQNAKVLLTYGGGSIKKNGVYKTKKKALGSRAVFEFGGIEPNPRYETCIKTLDIIKKEKKLKAKKLFLLTTQASDWFYTFGFKDGSVNDLPKGKIENYNKERSSKIMIMEI
jgi:hypothetical protein